MGPVNRWLTGLAALITIAAASLLIFLHFPWVISIERSGEVKKDPVRVLHMAPETLVAAPAPRTVFTDPSQRAAPVILTPSQLAAPAPAVEQPIQQPATRKAAAHKKPKAATKLKAKWAAPPAKPFDIMELFNAH